MTDPPPVPLGEALRVWWRIALLSFGGPAGQIAVMHRILVEERRWIGERRFLHALNFCMLLPGPEAQQLATYIGWLMHRTVGGLIAGILFVLPGAAAIMVLSWVYLLYGRVEPVEALFFGLKAAVLAIVFDAVRRIGGRALRSRAAVALATAAFVALFFFAAPFPLVVAIAGVIGYVAGRAGSHAFAGGGHGPAGGATSDDHATVLGEELPPHARRGLRATAATAAILLAAWLAPIALLLAALGPDNVFAQIAWFFGKLALVTFGGAYAVLAYVAQEAVERYRWLVPGEMMDGLGLAETTPGPLIMVTQFVAFLGAAREAGTMPPLLAGTLGGLLATWVTFVPSFLWIFVGAPYSERLRGHAALSAALAAITAAVVGVVLNLALWFGLHTLFGALTPVRAGPLAFELPDLATLRPAAAALTVAAAVALIRFRLGVPWVLAGCAIAGIVLHYLGVPGA